MIVISKAILHILDITADKLLLSDQELSLAEGINEFLEKHIEKAISLQEAKCGSFYEDSEFRERLEEYIDGKTDFVNFSKTIAESLNKINSQAKEASLTDFLVLDVNVDDERKIILLKAANHQGFMHNVKLSEQGRENEIVSQWSIMPSMTQRMDEFAVIDVATKDLRVLAKRYELDGSMVFSFSELFLECALLPSARETIRTIRDTAKKVAEEFGRDEIRTMAAVKSAISSEAENKAELNPVDAGRKIFADNPAMQKEFEEKIEKRGLDKTVPVNREATMKKMRNHKLQTDTGIELSIPVDYLENTEFVEFNTNPDGSLSITLKHITNITNRA